jgi:divalent metal cation (Fe/Co/Zn/Cd) transporter
MNQKTKKLVGVAIFMVGISIALAGVRMKAKDPQSSGTMTWVGLAIAFVGVSRTMSKK